MPGMCYCIYCSSGTGPPLPDSKEITFFPLKMLPGHLFRFKGQLFYCSQVIWLKELDGSLLDSGGMGIYDNMTIYMSMHLSKFNRRKKSPYLKDKCPAERKSVSQDKINSLPVKYNSKNLCLTFRYLQFFIQNQNIIYNYMEKIESTDLHRHYQELCPNEKMKCLILGDKLWRDWVAP